MKRYKCLALPFLLLSLLPFVAGAQPSDSGVCMREAADSSRSCARAVGSRTWNWEVHSNTLLPLLNVGGGVTMGPKGRFSLAADWYYPWIWPPRSNRWCAELLAGGVTARWTFRDGTDPYRRGTGFSLGLGPMAGYFDFQRNWRGIQGEAIAAVLDARWTFPINRGRWRLAVGAGAGYMRVRLREYEVYERGGDLFRTGEYSRRVNYWGPLRADVTLIIPFWHDKDEGAR